MSYRRLNELIFSLNIAAAYVLESSANRTSSLLWNLPFHINEKFGLEAHSKVGGLVTLFTVTLGLGLAIFFSLRLLARFAWAEYIVGSIAGIAALCSVPVSWYFVTHIGIPSFAAEQTASLWLPFELAAVAICGLLTIYREEMLPRRTGIAVVACHYLLFCWLFSQTYYFNRPFIVIYPMLSGLAYWVWAEYMLREKLAPVEHATNPEPLQTNG